ncbi:hypothetical protein M422DRAFT_216196 [Sphaerobolus stellatus SS14]|uniref:tRNA (adenine(58)-N(1))-methyltransferase catalytic subunit TRM61 n=1 Tax=Sphaerobolus stellatus (strain SS14) TaxID=990650 RepID=A0A0C9TBZ8_SPHS4|nr:hypothetical protein M422DRAFT_216196 [Sphaerobolus stellatus SS14]
MWSRAKNIAPGDTVVLWLTRDNLHIITVTPGQEYTGRFGTYHHADLLGVPYGSKVPARNGKGFLHVLRPTPELWTMALPHRTQILYLADISFIMSRLAIRPGSHVLEAGTGSGSMSHSLARTIGPFGRLYTFEFHAQRALKAQEEFLQHGLAERIILKHQNVCKDGFGLSNAVDAIFLDLPMPWEAIKSAKEASRKDRTVRICCFSPCIEQVLRTVSVLNQEGFTDIAMYETLIRPHDVFVQQPTESLKEARERLQAAEQAKEDRRQRQIEQSKVRKAVEHAAKEGGAEGESSQMIGIETADGAKRKRDPEGEEPTVAALPPPKKPAHMPKQRQKQEAKSSPQPEKGVVSQPIKEVRGHTSYLTFAVLLPSNLHNPSATSTTNPTSNGSNQYNAAQIQALDSLPDNINVIPEPEQEQEDYEMGGEDGGVVVPGVALGEPVVGELRIGTAEEDVVSIDPVPPYLA